LNGRLFTLDREGRLGFNYPCVSPLRRLQDLGLLVLLMLCCAHGTLFSLCKIWNCDDINLLFNNDDAVEKFAISTDCDTLY